MAQAQLLTDGASAGGAGIFHSRMDGGAARPLHTDAHGVERPGGQAWASPGKCGRPAATQPPRAPGPVTCCRGAATRLLGSGRQAGTATLIELAQGQGKGSEMGRWETHCNSLSVVRTATRPTPVTPCSVEKQGPWKRGGCHQPASQKPSNAAKPAT